MMQGGFLLQINETQISSILHHLVDDEDVPLPDGSQKQRLLFHWIQHRTKRL